MRLEICLYLLYREHHRDQRTATTSTDVAKDGREGRGASEGRGGSEGRHGETVKDEREERREQTKDNRLESSVREIISQTSHNIHRLLFGLSLLYTRWRGPNSFSKFDHDNINGGAVDGT
jgi:hypothetical protein